MPGITGGNSNITQQDVVFIEAQLQKGFDAVVTSQLIEIGPSSIQILGVNPSRKYAHFINTGDCPIWLQYGSNAIVNRGIRLSAGAMWTVSGWDLFLGKIYAISEYSSTLDVLEGQ